MFYYGMKLCLDVFNPCWSMHTHTLRHSPLICGRWLRPSIGCDRCHRFTEPVVGLFVCRFVVHFVCRVKFHLHSGRVCVCVWFKERWFLSGDEDEEHLTVPTLLKHSPTKEKAASAATSLKRFGGGTKNRKERLCPVLFRSLDSAACIHSVGHRRAPLTRSPQAVTQRQ